MNSPQSLSDGERQRILRVMGYELWQRRTGDYRPVRPAVAEARSERARVMPTVEPRRAASSAVPAPMPAPVDTPAAVPRPRARPQQARAVMLVLEKRVHADLKFIKHLVLALPGSTICTSDTVAGGSARFAVQLGVDANLPSDVLGLRVPALTELQRSASARRALWWSIKPVLRALQV